MTNGNIFSELFFPLRWLCCSFTRQWLSSSLASTPHPCGGNRFSVHPVYLVCGWLLSLPDIREHVPPIWNCPSSDYWKQGWGHGSKGRVSGAIVSLSLELLMCIPLPWLLPKETLDTYALEFIEGHSERSWNVLWESAWSVLMLTVSCVQTWSNHIRATWRKASSPCFLPTRKGIDMHRLFSRVWKKELRAKESFCKT